MELGRIEIRNTDYNSGSLYGKLGMALDKQQLRKMLEKNGYSGKAIKAILRWYD